jgi:hypothetical protein
MVVVCCAPRAHLMSSAVSWSYMQIRSRMMVLGAGQGDADGCMMKAGAAGAVEHRTLGKNPSALQWQQHSPRTTVRLHHGCQLLTN